LLELVVSVVEAWAVAQSLRVLVAEVLVSALGELEVVMVEVLCPLRLALVAAVAHKLPLLHRMPQALRISKEA